MAIRARWIVALVMVVFVGAVFVLAIGLWIGNRAPSVASGSTLVLDLAGGVAEDLPPASSSNFFYVEAPTVWDITSAIRHAADNEKIDAIVMKIRSPGLGWAKVEEFREALLYFKKSEKPVICWIESGEDIDYYLATVANEIYAPSGANIGVDGLAMYVTFIKGSLDWAGVKADFESVGEYKSFGETFTRKRMSEPSREAHNALLDDQFSNYLEAISESRGWGIDETRETIDRGPYVAEEALSAGLVDAIAYEEDVELDLGVEFGGDMIPMEEYIETADNDNRGMDRVALVYASGTIVRGESGFDPLFGRTLGHRTFDEAMREARDDERVRAIVLRVDSPGGDTYASRSMWHSVAMAAEQKPVIASFSDYAASGGYYLAMGAESIVAQPGTLTGSIGVVGGKFNISGLYKKIGIDVEVISRGANSQFNSSMRDFTPAEREKYLAQLYFDYQQFIDVVSANRGQDEESVEERARGRVWSGGQAFVNGLVDTLGGFETAIALARASAGIGEDEEIRFVVYPRVNRTFLQILLNELLFEGETAFSDIREPALELLRSVARLAGSKSLSWLPYRIDIR